MLEIDMPLAIRAPFGIAHVHLAKRLHKESTCGIMRVLTNPDAQELSNDHHTASD